MDQAILDKLIEINTNVDTIKLLMPLYMQYSMMFLGIIYGGIMALITASELKAMR